ncbi:acyl-CoA thioesterase [Marinobacter sp. C2H3]|uniref:acyl-CoA thioesterase n=1 Tax=Marinobacter sp. C2H3 TaxID=3119003 RepID=UPI00300EE651
MTDTSLHPLDNAIKLEPQGGHRFRGRFPASHFNMVGPYGGAIGAALMNAVLLHPERMGNPVAMTVNFAGPVQDADYEIIARPARTNRSTQHWMLELVQGGETAVTGTLFMAVRRETWEDQELTMPDVPPADDIPPLNTDGYLTWLQNYRFRVIDGHFDPSGRIPPQEDSTTRLWMQDNPPRKLDFPALMALSDGFFPRVFVRQQERSPAGTVSLTTYFHTDDDRLAASGDRPILGIARGQKYFRNYFDQVAELWSEQGELLATSHQVVYFKA